MQYPLSPFDKIFNVNTIFEGCHSAADKDFVDEILKWLCTPPEITYYKVNTLATTVDDVLHLIETELKKIAAKKTLPIVQKHSLLHDTIIVHKWQPSEQDLQKRPKEVVIDVSCGASVLRGAHVFAPAVMGMENGAKIEDKVSIYADVSKKCKQGWTKVFECNQKLFVGNGIIKMTRNELFGLDCKPKGIAVEVVDTVSGCPSIGEAFLSKGFALLQNISSILCVHVLNPQPKDVVLDMCASPGHKTIHIAALMKNTGTLIAIDKTQSKVKKLKTTCDEFSANVNIFEADSTKIVLDEGNVAENFDLIKGPPFFKDSFDKILLDAPCSGLGQRPQLRNEITEKVLKSYVPLQRKLFQSAVSLLKPKGTLVYSTCTIAVGENEKMVAWVLDKFKNLMLVKTEPILGGPGLPNYGLNEEEINNVQRFGPNQQEDSVGFFIAKFVKK